VSKFAPRSEAPSDACGTQKWYRKLEQVQEMRSALDDDAQHDQWVPGRCCRKGEVMTVKIFPEARSATEKSGEEGVGWQFPQPRDF
jgi:hypothetical protein